MELSYGRYEYDADRLISVVKRALTPAAGPDTALQSPPGNAVERPVTHDPARAARLLTSAERVARAMSDNSDKASALATVARAVAAASPSRAARLAADAERIARSFGDETAKAGALASIAGNLAATDPAHAERMANPSAIGS